MGGGVCASACRRAWQWMLECLDSHIQVPSYPKLMGFASSQYSCQCQCRRAYLKAFNIDLEYLYIETELYG